MPFLVEKRGKSENPTYSPIPFGVGAKEGAEGEKTTNTKCSRTPTRKLWHCKKLTYKTHAKNAEN